MPTPYHRAAVHLRHASSVVVCGHLKPDGDAIGSVLGLTLALRQAGIPAVPTLADDRPAPKTYEFLPGFALFMPVSDLEVPDVFVALDTPGFGRLGIAEELARRAETLIVIDHHPDNDEFGTVNVLDSRAAASGQMVWRLIERLEIDPSPEIALCCYVALMTDTGRFQYDNTSPQAFRDAAAMLEAGVDAAEASRQVYQERSAGSLAIESIVLSRLTIANNGRVAYSWVAEEDYEQSGSLPVESEHLPDAIRVIGGIEIAMLLRVHPTEVRGNLRAKTGFDVGAVAQLLGGGGHRAAAGFTVEGDLEETLARVLPLLPGA
jgi:phosphoesterase RecJ-like protein